MTPKGEQFVRNEITVPKYARLYNGELLKLHGRDWSIEDALGKDFNYRELMSS